MGSQATQPQSVFNAAKGQNSSWVELGRFDEAEPVLEKAIRMAPPGYDLPANNLHHLRQLRAGRRIS